MIAHSWYQQGDHYTDSTASNENEYSPHFRLHMSKQNWSLSAECSLQQEIYMTLWGHKYNWDFEN